MVRDVLLTEYPVVSPYLPSEEAAEMFKKQQYLVVREEDNYLGLLTPKDLSFNRKVLIGDSIKTKPSVGSMESVPKAVTKLLDSGFNALPCIDESCFTGVFTEERAFSWMCGKMHNEEIKVNFTNLIGEERAEEQKARFLSELSHQTRNPIQILYSGMDLLSETALTIEQQDILKMMLTSTAKMETLMSELFAEYLDEDISKILH